MDEPNLISKCCGDIFFYLFVFCFFFGAWRAYALNQYNDQGTENINISGPLPWCLSLDYSFEVKHIHFIFKSRSNCDFVHILGKKNKKSNATTVITRSKAANLQKSTEICDFAPALYANVFRVSLCEFAKLAIGYPEHRQTKTKAEKIGIFEKWWSFILSEFLVCR